VDHDLADGSAAVAGTAAQRCRDLGLGPVDVVRVDVPTGPGAGGLEAAARDARYAALDAAADRHGAVAILLGHTLDDQAETVLLGLARGSGARSLAGMRARNGLLLRPFLGLRRSGTERVCRDLGLTWWDDPTNDGTVDRAPLRSRVRTSVLPVLEDVLGPGVTEALARTADQLHDDDVALSSAAEDLLSRAQPQGGGLDPEVLLGAPAAVRTRALRRAAVAAGSAPGALARRHVLEIDRLVTEWHGQGPVHLPGAVLARRDCGRLVLERATAGRPATEPSTTRPTEESSRGTS
ncbi:tRNA lysidine(34) synthetase TilS, partial [Sanguibacter suaedae]